MVAEAAARGPVLCSHPFPYVSHESSSGIQVWIDERATPKVLEIGAASNPDVAGSRQVAKLPLPPIQRNECDTMRGLVSRRNRASLVTGGVNFCGDVESEYD